MADCKCLTPPHSYLDFESRHVGFDGGYGEVTIKKCRFCGANWLDYHYRNEAYTASGRWYRGIVSPEVAATIKPDEALDALDRLPWHLMGGSYFQSTGQLMRGPVWRP